MKKELQNIKKDYPTPRLTDIKDEIEGKSEKYYYENVGAE